MRYPTSRIEFVALWLLAAAAVYARLRLFFRLVNDRVRLFYARFRCFRHRRVLYRFARLFDELPNLLLARLLFHRRDAKGLGRGTPFCGDARAPDSFRMPSDLHKWPQLDR